MRHLSLSISLLLLATGCAASCNSEEPEPVAAPSFDQARAWADLEAMVAIGPRPMGTPALERTREYLRQQLDGHGWSLEEVPFTAVAPRGAARYQNGKEWQGINLLARREGTEPGEIWIASHYDTYDKRGFVGANDAGSSSAVLLELARQLGGEGPRTGPALVLAWLDGEEPFSPVPWSNVDNSTFGSRHQVALLKEQDRLKDLRAFVLMDMVGDAKLGITPPRECDRRLLSLFETTAHQLGYKRLFFEKRDIRDDHVPFHQARVPVINLIDLKFGPGLGNEWWHTHEDELSKCSADSLGTIGQLVLATLPKIAGEFPVRR